MQPDLMETNEFVALLELDHDRFPQKSEELSLRWRVQAAQVWYAVLLSGTEDLAGSRSVDEVPIEKGC